MAKKYDEVISQIIVELDDQHATYQMLHRKFHGREDESARNTYSLLVDLCERIRKSLCSQERK